MRSNWPCLNKPISLLYKIRVHKFVIFYEYKYGLQDLYAILLHIDV